MAEPSRFIDANGLRFAVDEVGEGDRVAILLHGFPQNRSCWRHLLAPLAAMGWHVVAPDLRGYGASSRPTERKAYKIDNLVADVAGLFAALGARQRLLIGHDWGGAIAWSYALEGLPLDGLVIVNMPHPTLFRRALRHSPEQRKRSWYIGFFQTPWLPEKVLGARGAWAIGAMLRNTSRGKRAFPPPVLEAYRAAARQPGALAAMLAYYRVNISNFGLIKTPPPIYVPTLMVWGEADVALGLETIKGTEKLVPDLTLARLKGVSHWVPEEAPDALLAKLTEWLEAKGLAEA